MEKNINITVMMHSSRQVYNSLQAPIFVHQLKLSFYFSDSSTFFLKLHWVAKITILIVTIVLALAFVMAFLAVSRFLVRKRRRKRRSLDKMRKTELSQGSLSHSEDDNNPDLIPQNTSEFVYKISKNFSPIPTAQHYFQTFVGFMQLQGSVVQC